MIRFRPIMLTALAVVAGATVILTDPIFQGLAIALMAGSLISMFIAPVLVPCFISWRKNRGLRPGGNHCQKPRLRWSCDRRAGAADLPIELKRFISHSKMAR